MTYDPKDAKDPTPPTFKNVMRCTANEIITMAEAVSRGRYYQGLPEGVGENEPYWDFYFEALDAKWLRDGSFLAWPAAGRLFTKAGHKMDNTQRPFRVSVAFAGLPEKISVFPGDPEGKHDTFCSSIGHDPIGVIPDYDASKVVGRVFLCILEKMEVGRDLPLPITAYPEGYIYTDKVRELGSSTGGGVNEDGAVAPSLNTSVDILAPDGAETLAQVLKLIDGQPADAELFDLLHMGGVDSRAMIDGESVIGVTVTEGALVAKLEEAGHASVVDGRIAVSS